MQAGEKETELLALLEKSPKNLWNTDLDLFLQEWEVSNSSVKNRHVVHTFWI